MSDLLDGINSLPDISFIDNLTLENVQAVLINAFQDKYREITKKKIALARADPYRVMLLASAQLIYQGLQNIDKAGKMNFLKYARGDYLKNLAALKGVVQHQPKKAMVPVRWKLAAPREAATAIPAGSRVTASYEVYFETLEYNEIPPGDTEITVMMSCTEAGEIGNGFMPGELSVMVDPVGFVDSVSNTETSAGGTDTESDGSMAERAFLAPSSYSTAGPDDAYIFWTKNFDSRIGDVLPVSPAPGVVVIYFIMDDGTLPNDTEIEGVLGHLQQRSKRPLTDKVEVARPGIVPYSINAKYYISTSSVQNALQIQRRAEAALEEYRVWQCSKIGRDINPDMLKMMLKLEGVKRIEIEEPGFTVLNETEVALLEGCSLVYGGLEDD